MKFGLGFVVIYFAATAAFAQQIPSSPPPSTAIERISGSLAQCIMGAEKMVDQLADAQKQLVAAQTKIKELEAKPKE